ncbi:uncharacterized protein T551_03559 [Pneumocystis jirovecii RU7]|uniref:Uncharacterized protein n=1 Tax=Pneumocystis jirovecii (strain RU7) TaxID=1408657 RepID=A0A0W4ZCW7_PNEJ7|nr:uncharacterized protein T551_03559 [Pneumocystis jirovecii RU7]KTW26260.1 hypothetical protein T551_03559 [Pneumocystis jirovecii RU7]
MSTTVKEKNETNPGLSPLQAYFERIPSIVNAPLTHVLHLTNFDGLPIFTTSTSTAQFQNLTFLSILFTHTYEMISRLQLGRPKRVFSSYFSPDKDSLGAEMVQIGCMDDKSSEYREIPNSLDNAKTSPEITKKGLPLIGSIVGTKGTMASAINIAKEIEKVAQIVIKNWH